jgi:hypothetical protein
MTERELQSREQAARMRAFFERNDRRIAEAFTSSPRTDAELEARAAATAIMNGSNEMTSHTIKVLDVQHEPGSGVDAARRSMGMPYSNGRGETVCPCGAVTGFNLRGEMPARPDECLHEGKR